MTLKLEKPARLAIRFRVPGWCQGISLAVNGLPIHASAAPSGWASIDREWRSGDTVVITIPMALRTVPVDREHPDRAAILYGPVVLAQDEACCRRPFSTAPTTELNKRRSREGQGLRFRMTNIVPERHTRYLQPLYSVPGFWPDLGILRPCRPAALLESSSRKSGSRFFAKKRAKSRKIERFAQGSKVGSRAWRFCSAPCRADGVGHVGAPYARVASRHRRSNCAPVWCSISALS